MASSISMLSLVAAAYYVLVALACMLACGTASHYRQPRWYRDVWLALAILFLVLIALRGLGIEEWARDALRDVLRSGGSYGDRRSTQGIVASIVLVIVAAAGLLWLYRAASSFRGRRNVVSLVALASGSAMALLVLLRLISLHMIDRALYGPLKINWIGDIGTSTLVLVCAIYYAKLVRARP